MKLDRNVSRLLDVALSVRKNAYCPYSRYPVGAAVLTAAGRIFTGCNVENASYGLSLCAERVAIFNAATRGEFHMKAIMVAANSAKPCGACRQVMGEFATKDTEVYLADLRRGKPVVTKTSMAKLLPAAFDPLESGLLAKNPRNLLQERIERRRRGRKLRNLKISKGGRGR